MYEAINVHSTYKDMYGQLQSLINMVENNVPVEPSIDDVFRAFCVALSADQAIKEDRIIECILDKNLLS